MWINKRFPVSPLHSFRRSDVTFKHQHWFSGPVVVMIISILLWNELRATWKRPIEYDLSLTDRWNIDTVIGSAAWGISIRWLGGSKHLIHLQSISISRWNDSSSVATYDLISAITSTEIDSYWSRRDIISHLSLNELIISLSAFHVNQTGIIERLKDFLLNPIKNDQAIGQHIKTCRQLIVNNQVVTVFYCAIWRAAQFASIRYLFRLCTTSTQILYLDDKSTKWCSIRNSNQTPAP